MLGVTVRVALLFSVVVTGEHLVVTHNGPVVLGATVTVHAKLYDDLNQRVTNNYGLCNYGFSFTDDAEPRNQFLDFSKSCSSEFRIKYEAGLDAPRTYNITVIAYAKRGMRYWPIARTNTMMDVTPFLNGNIELYQNGQAVPHDDAVFLHAGVTARVVLSAPDNELLSSLGATFKTDWSFEIDALCNGCRNPRVWSLARNAQPGSSFDIRFTSFHGSYVEVRARLCAVVPNATDLTSLGNTYGFFYRRFLLLDPWNARRLSNFTVESDRKTGHIVVNDEQVDAVIVEN